VSRAGWVLVAATVLVLGGGLWTVRRVQGVGVLVVGVGGGVLVSVLGTLARDLVRRGDRRPD